jgi:hypothetical protein
VLIARPSATTCLNSAYYVLVWEKTSGKAVSTASVADPIQEACLALSPSTKRKEEGKGIKIIKNYSQNSATLPN